MSTVDASTPSAGRGRAMADGLAASGGGTPSPEPTARIGRLERSALSGVLVREVINFSSYWRGSTFSSTVEPTIYLLAFGFGFGSIVSQVGGYDYVDFVGTGTVATAVLFATAMPAMFGTFIKYKFQRTYDAILAAPVDTEELVTAEALWLAIRASVFGCAPLLAAILFGLDPRGWMLVVPFINFVAGFGWACFGICIAAFLKAMESFSYVTSGFITPVMLTAGTFFPLTNLPDWVQVAGWLNPLHHTVELVRHASFGWEGWVDVAHASVLVAFALILWRVAIIGMQRKLIT
jgi:lipooligosaccharide transport system permease protein